MKEATKLSIEYHEAKKNYKAAKGKENNGVDVTQKRTVNSLRSSFATKQTNKQSSSKPMNTQLPAAIEYNTTKQLYKSSKSRAARSSSTSRDSSLLSSAKMNTHPPSEYNATKRLYSSSKSRAASRKSTPVTSSSSNPVVMKNKSDCVKSRSTPSTATAESGLKALGLIRPLDNKTYEFGLSTGIRLHLIESVKLCGLKKGREKSIVDMITTLCSHLTNREDEICRWIEFADKIALSSAIKFEESTQQYQDVCLSRDDAQDATKEAQTALMKIRNEVLTLKNTLQTIRDGVTDILNSFPPVLSDFQHELKRHLTHHQDSLKSECKTEISDVIEEVTRAHDNEKQRLETKIGSLEMSLQVEEERSKSIQSNLDDASMALEKEKRIHMLVQTDLKADAEKSVRELREANDKIKSLERHLQEERIQAKKKMSDMEEKMHEDLDDIDKRVKANNEKKDKEIGKLVERARVAEASAEAASKLLSELKASVVVPPRYKAAEDTSEN